MPRVMKTIFVIGIIIVIVGLSGRYFASDGFDISIKDNKKVIGYSNSFMGRGSMYNTFNNNWDSKVERIDFETLKENVEDFINKYDENLVISDIFIFEDSDYYFSIKEEDTGFGAMELLVNPYTGDIYPEYGPNMMWNLKYGMHSSIGYDTLRGNHMMGRRGIIRSRGFSTKYNINNQNFDGNSLGIEEAKNIAENYIESQASEGYTISEGGHEYYGYYTFHIEKENKIIGMLSVNGFSGDVWYHHWHGTVKEIVENH